MTIIKLLHPVHGLVAQQVIHGLNTSEMIKRNWRYKYGKNYIHCKTELEVSDAISKDVIRKK